MGCCGNLKPAKAINPYPFRGTFASEVRGTTDPMHPFRWRFFAQRVVMPHQDARKASTVKKGVLPHHKELEQKTCPWDLCPPFQPGVAQRRDTWLNKKPLVRRSPTSPPERVRESGRSCIRITFSNLMNQALTRNRLKPSLHRFTIQSGWLYAHTTTLHLNNGVLKQV